MSSLVSIIIPYFNGGLYLFDCLQSVLDESIENLEILVVDDGSTEHSLDQALEQVRCFRDVAVYSKSHGGPASCQNFGVRQARGEFICFIDQDDCLQKHGLTRRLRWLEENPTALGVYGTIENVIDENKKIRGNWQEILGHKFPKPQKRLSLSFFKTHPELPCTQSLFMYRRKLVEKIGWFDESLRIAHDRDYLYRILKFTSLDFIDVPIIRYRVHPHNASLIWNGMRPVCSRRSMGEQWLVDTSYGSH